MITHYPIGKATPKVQVSAGPSHDIMDFYHTRYASDYVPAANAEVHPKKFLHRGTGYASNLRPVVTYSAKFDKESNPYMFEVNQTMYDTQTKTDYVKYVPAPNEMFPKQLTSSESGYVRDVKSHNVGASEFQKLWHSNPKCSDCPQPHKPLLDKLHAHSCIPQCYGDTEYRVRHTGEQLPSDMTLLDTKVIGCLEPTGHLVNKNIEPITYSPPITYLHPQPDMRNYSIYQASYQPFATGTGLEPLPDLISRANRNTGNTRENMDTNPPFIPIHPKDFHYPQHKMPGDSTELRNARPKEGEFKEESGAVLNRTNHISLDPCLASKHQWQSHYNAVHTDLTPEGVQRDGHCRVGIQKQTNDAYTRSTGWTKFNPVEAPANTINRVHPTVAKSILAENPRFGYPLYQKQDEVSAC